MQIKVYSRPGVGDECDMGRLEYNGSFSVEGDDRALTDIPANTFEGWAKMMDCFQECVFVRIGSIGVSEHAIEYSRTWE